MSPKIRNALVVLLVMFTAMAIGTLTTIDMGDQPQAQQTDQARDNLPLGRTATAIVDGAVSYHGVLNPGRSQHYGRPAKHHNRAKGA